MSSPIKTTICLFLFLFLSCANPMEEKRERLERFTAEHEIDLSEYNSILVLTENTCPACLKPFASLLEKQLENKRSLLLISARGTYVDISMFLKAEEASNILYDWKQDFKEQNISKGSSAIFLDNVGAIDTIVSINAKGLRNTLTYISNRLE